MLLPPAKHVTGFTLPPARQLSRPVWLLPPTRLPAALSFLGTNTTEPAAAATLSRVAQLTDKQLCLSAALRAGRQGRLWGTRCSSRLSGERNLPATGNSQAGK